jgi:hypothetical protein
MFEEVEIGGVGVPTLSWVGLLLCLSSPKERGKTKKAASKTEPGDDSVSKKPNLQAADGVLSGFGWLACRLSVGTQES